VGASNGFVRRPFLYSGLWLGLVAGIVALVVVLGSQLALAAPVERLLESYEHRFVLNGLPLSLVACVPLASAALGWLGAMLATARHLAEGNPQ
jgi:cell division transport system permease protein